MSDSQLTLESRFIDYDDDTTFIIKANNENCAVSLKFYGTPEEFNEFGRELVSFPQNANHEVYYPSRGSYEENATYVYWLTIRAFCYDPNGHAALEITINNNEPQPWSYQAKFCIQTDAATLNRLGQRLRGWDVKSRSGISLYDKE